MGREVRMVPADWQHPKTDRYGDDRHEPLYEGCDYEPRMKEWVDYFERNGLQETLDWMGNPPDKNDYMPDWPKSEKTHFMMYSNTSEGTPISPAFETKEEMCQWLVDNKASAFGYQPATYEWWMDVATGGIGMVAIAPGVVAI